MKLTDKMLAVFLFLFSCPALVIAGEFKIGGFEFDLPGTWEVNMTKTELTATRGDKRAPSALLKIEVCISTELKPCELPSFIAPPTDSNPENCFCGETTPTKIKHANGLDEVRKVCSTNSASGKSKIGMLYLLQEKHSLGLMLFVGENDPAPSEFLNAFLSSLVLQ